MYHEGIALSSKYGIYSLLIVLFTNHDSSKQLTLKLKMEECFCPVDSLQFNLHYIHTIKQKNFPNPAKS